MPLTQWIKHKQLHQVAMILLFLLPVVLSSLLFAAHFLRMGALLPAVFCLVIPASLFVKARWPVWLTQGFLALAAFEWVRTLMHYLMIYQQQGRSPERLVAILGCVIVFTLISILVFRLKRLRQRYFQVEV